jgi:hypothetical protein
MSSLPDAAVQLHHPKPRTMNALLLLARRVCATTLAGVLVCLSPPSVRAAPAESSPPTAEREPPTSDAPELPDEAAVHSALQDGDLTTARDIAVARSAADPSVDNLVLEAQVWAALGDHENAKRAYAAARDTLPADAVDERESIDEEIAALELASRGTVADEPVSTERERLDAERAERLAALAPKPPPPMIVDKPKPVPITKKWYFWVTLGAIAASAGAIVGIAVSSAVEERRDTAGTAARQPIPVGGMMLRF